MTLEATRGVTSDEQSIRDVLIQAHEVLRTEEVLGCGDFVAEFVDKLNEQPFITVDFEAETIRLEPLTRHSAGTFD